MLLLKRFFLLFLCIIAFARCSNPNPVNENPLVDSVITKTIKIAPPKVLCDSILPADSLAIALKRWIGFYKKKYSNFSLNDFKFQHCSHDAFYTHEDEVSKEDLQLYHNLLVYAPDGKRFLDLDSYNYFLKKDKNGNLVGEGGDPETEVSIMDQSAKTRTRLSFTGMETVIDDAAWLGANKVVIVFLSDPDGKSKVLVPNIQVIDLQTGNSSFFSSTLKIEDKFAGDYTKVRRKNIRESGMQLINIE